MKDKGNIEIFQALPPWTDRTLRFALIKYGGGIVQMSGSIAGNTHARNRYGNYSRARTTPVNPKSARQTAARTRLQQLVENWNADLTAAQRGAWETYANAIGWNNKLGEMVHLTGFNHFVRSNCAILACGGSIVQDGPTVLSLPNGDPTFAITLSAANGITITFDDTLDWCDEDGGYLSLELGEPQLVSRNFFGTPWRFEAHVDGDSVAPPTSPVGPQAVNAWTLVEGQRLWCRARIIRADGRTTTQFGSAPFTVGA